MSLAATHRPVSAHRRRAAILRQLRIWSGVAACALFLLPIAWMLLTSLKFQRDIFTTPPKIFFTPTLDTYIAYLTNHDLPARMLNTLIVAGGSGLVSIIAGAMAARSADEGRSFFPRPGGGNKLGLKVVDERVTLLSDPEKEVLTAWGAFGEKKLYGKVVNGVIRSTFVVDPEGKISHAAYNVKATGHVAKLRRDLGLD